MSKHEFHIGLMLIALITAGVLGYQWANGGKPLSVLETAITPGDFSYSAAESGMESPAYIPGPDFDGNYFTRGDIKPHGEYRELPERAGIDAETEMEAGSNQDAPAVSSDTVNEDPEMVQKTDKLVYPALLPVPGGFLFIQPPVSEGVKIDKIPAIVTPKPVSDKDQSNQNRRPVNKPDQAV